MNILTCQLQLRDLLRTENDYGYVCSISEKGLVKYKSARFNDGLTVARRAEDLHRIYISVEFLLNNGWQDIDNCFRLERKNMTITIEHPSECTWIVSILTSRILHKKPVSFIDELQKMIRNAEDFEFANNLKI